MCGDGLCDPSETQCCQDCGCPEPDYDCLPSGVCECTTKEVAVAAAAATAPTRAACYYGDCCYPEDCEPYQRPVKPRPDSKKKPKRAPRSQWM